MNIPILCLQNGGFGDLLFAQKLAYELQHYFEQKSIDVNIFIVALPDSINDMKKLGLMKEFNIPVASPHDIYEKTQDPNANFQIDYMIVAPSFVSKSIFDWNAEDMYGMNGYEALNRRGNLHQGALKENICYIGEYNNHLESSAIALHQQFFKEDVQSVNFLRTGIFPSEKDTNILISSDEVQNKMIAKNGSQWETIKASKIKDRLPKDFYFEYSSNYVNSSTKRYLEVLLPLSAQKEQTDINVLCIGDENKKRDALQKIKEEIKAQGFTRIEFVNLENENEPEILYDANVKENEKVYRVFYAKNLPHNVMTSVLNVSDQFVGVTGDQSLSEAISMLDKIIFYERLNHKINLSFSYQDFIYSKCPNEEVKEKMVKFLQNLGNYEQKTDLGELAALIVDPQIQEVLKIAHLEMAQNCSLSNQLGDMLLSKLANHLEPLNSAKQNRLVFNQAPSPAKPKVNENKPVEIKAQQQLNQEKSPPLQQGIQAKMMSMAKIMSESISKTAKEMPALSKEQASLTKPIQQISDTVVGLYSLIFTAQDLGEGAKFVENFQRLYLESISDLAIVVTQMQSADKTQMMSIKASVGALMGAGMILDAKSGVDCVKRELSTLLNTLSTPEITSEKEPKSVKPVSQGLAKKPVGTAELIRKGDGIIKNANPIAEQNLNTKEDPNRFKYWEKN